MQTSKVSVTSPASLYLFKISRLIHISSSKETPIIVFRIRLSRFWSKLPYITLGSPNRMARNKTYPVYWSYCYTSQRHHQSSSHLRMPLTKSPPEYYLRNRVSISQSNLRSHWTWLTRCTILGKWCFIGISRTSSIAPVAMLLLMLVLWKIPV